MLAASLHPQASDLPPPCRTNITRAAVQIREASLHVLYQSLEKNDTERQSAYRAHFSTELDRDAIDDIRLALNQSQLFGSERFHREIQNMRGMRREARPRGRPHKDDDTPLTSMDGQGDFGF